MSQPRSDIHDATSNALEDSGLCLLSLDGGGVRGLSSLYILKSIMDAVNQKRRVKGLTSVKPHEIFDLIGGTSTGGIIAIMLGRLQMDVDECITQYNSLIRKIFEKRAASLPIDWRFKTKARFDSDLLRQAIEDVLRERGFSLRDLFKPSDPERVCKTFVCAASTAHSGVVRIRNYEVYLEADIPATITEAALATSAASTIFEKVSIGDHTFVDGALGANNPIDEVEGEAINIWCGETGDLKPLVKCIISVGTGDPGVQKVKDSLLGLVGDTLVKLATQTEQTDKKFSDRWPKHLREQRFFRFNVDQGLQKVGLEEYKKAGEIHDNTLRYLSHQNQKIRLNNCVRNLTTKKDKASLDLASVVQDLNDRISANRMRASQTCCWTVPFPRNEAFVGRDDSLGIVEKKVLENDNHVRLSIFGLGGVGKTQVVIELAHRLKDADDAFSVLWMTAISSESLRKSYVEAAAALRIPGLDEPDTDFIGLVHRHLDEELSCKWLMIFDNVDELNVLRTESGTRTHNIVDSLPRSSKGRIIFTTRSKHIAIKTVGKPHNALELSHMDPTVSLELFSKALPGQSLVTQKHHAMKLLDLLAYLPLAITQAASYINENSCDIEDYLSFFAEQESRIIEILSENFEDEGRYKEASNPIASTWLISFERMQIDSPLAANLLSFMSCMDHRAIPRHILPRGNANEQTKAIGTLIAYGFIVKRTAQQLYDMHRLVHLVMRNWLRMQGQSDKWTNEVYDRLCMELPDVEKPKLDHDSLESWRLLLPHVPSALDQRLVHRSSNDTDHRGSGSEQGTLLEPKPGSNTSHSETQGLEDENALENDSAIVLDSEVDKAGSRKVESTQPAISAFAPLRNNETSDFTDKQLAVMRQSGLALFLDHRFEEAEAVFRRTTNHRKTTLGPKDPRTLDSIGHLALTLAEQRTTEKLQEAEELTLSLIEARKEVHGQDHVLRVTAESLLVQVWMHQGKSGDFGAGCERWRFIRKVSADARNDSRGSHSLSMAMIRMIAQRYMALHQWVNASMKLRDAMRWDEKSVYPIQALSDKANLNMAHANMGNQFRPFPNVDGVEATQSEIVQECRSLLGDSHPMTLNSIYFLAHFRAAKKLRESAMKLMREFIEGATSRLGPEHAETKQGILSLRQWENGDFVDYGVDLPPRKFWGWNTPPPPDEPIPERNPCFKNDGREGYLFEPNLRHTPSIWHIIFAVDSSEDS